jgi:hypothetical protein
VLHPVSEGSVLIGILTWRHSFAGEHSRPEAQALTFWPIVTLSIGGGYYIRSSGLWSFDIENNKQLIRLGVGLGKVFRTGHAVVGIYRQTTLRDTANVLADIDLPYSCRKSSAWLR